jgi:hypothetical protein
VNEAQVERTRSRAERKEDMSTLQPDLCKMI